MELPKNKVAALRKSPKNMVIYGPPKIGKTTVLSKLDDCLIIDLEGGSDMVEALKVKATNLSELAEIGKAIMQNKKPYKYVAIDTVTKLEEWCEHEGKKIYQNTPMGKNFDKDNKGTSVLSLPNGAGYLYLRMAFKKWMDRLNMLVSSKDLDLTGKIKQITCANADAIGYIYRENDKTMISFNSMDDITAGSRCDHLRGQEMELEWSKIFID